MMHRFSSRKGFTLIELMIVIAIIAILAAILVPNFIRARAQGQLTSCKSNLKNIGTALEMYATDNLGRYPDASAAGSKLTTADGGQQAYLKTIPTCPSAGEVTYMYAVHSNPDVYTLYCQGSGNGGNHAAAGCTNNFPAFSASCGLIENEQAAKQNFGSDWKLEGGTLLSGKK